MSRHFELPDEKMTISLLKEMIPDLRNGDCLHLKSLSNIEGDVHQVEQFVEYVLESGGSIRFEHPQMRVVSIKQKLGRKRTIPSYALEEYDKYMRKETTKVKICEYYGISRPTLDRYFKWIQIEMNAKSQ